MPEKGVFWYNMNRDLISLEKKKKKINNNNKKFRFYT